MTDADLKLNQEALKKLGELSSVQHKALLKVLAWSNEDIDAAFWAGWKPVHLLEAWMAGKRTWQDVQRMGQWSRRYIQEGSLWGDEPSETALTLIKQFRGNSGARIVEFGGGYGRDAVAYCDRGHKLTGIEQSKVGFDEMDRRIHEHILAENASLQHGSFRTASLPKHFSDAVAAHRVLHLINPRHHQQIADKIHETLTPGHGLAFISARDPDDFNPDQMELLDENGNVTEDQGPEHRETARYKGRPAHIINFFGQNKFARVFGQDFEIQKFLKGREVESLTNKKNGSPIMTSFLLAVMRSRSSDEIARANGQDFDELPPIEHLPSMAPEPPPVVNPPTQEK